MKTWKDKTILGAIAGSGEFKIIYSYGDSREPFPLVAFDLVRNRGGVVKWDKLGFVTKAGLVWKSVKKCKLIARHVDDMSDEEVFKLFEEAPIGHPDDFDEALEDEKDKDFVKENCPCLTDGFLYLLSIGVLPESLADEDVIWV